MARDVLVGLSPGSAQLKKRAVGVGVCAAEACAAREDAHSNIDVNGWFYVVALRLLLLQ